MLCGSSRLVWQNTGKLSLDVTRNNNLGTRLETCTNWARQSRYTAGDQLKMNGIIGRAYDKLESVYNKFVANGIKPSTAAIDAAKGIVEFCHTSPDTPLTAQLLRRAEDSIQAYTGCESAFKERCTMCRAVSLSEVANAEKPDIEPFSVKDSRNDLSN